MTDNENGYQSSQPLYSLATVTVMALKRLPITALKVGMFVVGFDRPLAETPFLQEFRIRTPSDIEQLKRGGVREAVIDSSKGCEVEPGRPDQRRELAAEPEPSLGLEPTPTEAAVPSARPKVTIARGRDLALAKETRAQFRHSVEKAFARVREEGMVHSEEVKAMAHEMTDKTLDHPAAFMGLIQTREFDPDLHDHLFAVCTVALLLGQQLGLDRARLQRVATGALLHDVGMLQLPRALARLSRTSSKRDRSLYESHPKLGVSLLLRSGSLHPDVLQIVEEHHVTPDRAGYPLEMRWERTTEASHIVLVADRYDELLTGQGGDPPLPSQQALHQLYNDARTHHLPLDPVSHLIRLVGVYPLFSLVKLNTGERGIVTSLTPGKAHQPMVTLIQDLHGRPYIPPVAVDLSEEPSDRAGRAIVEVLDAKQEGVRIEEFLPVSAPDVPSEVEAPRTDRRRSPRFSVQLRVAFSGDTLTGEGLMVNLSAEGCAVGCDETVPIGTNMALRIVLPDQEAPLRVDQAVVRWSMEGAFGLEFLRMQPEEQARLRHFVSTLETRQSH